MNIRNDDIDQHETPNPNRELLKKFEHFSRLHHAWRAHQHHRGGHIDTTRGQGRVLAALRLKDGIPTRELAYVLGIRVPSLNEALAKLEKAGHIQREADERDKRVQLITLTDSGRKIAGRAGEDSAENTDIFDVLSNEERAHLNEYMDRLITRLHEEFPDADSGREAWEKAVRERMGDEAFEGFKEWGERVRERTGYGPFGMYPPPRKRHGRRGRGW